MSVSGKIERIRRFVHEATAGHVTPTPTPTPTPPPWLQMQGKRGAESSSARKSIVIVVHEASQTGAPKIALDLGYGFAEDLNVIYVLLRTGPRIHDFLENSVELILAEDPQHWSNLVEHLVDSYRISACILNSIESGEMAGPFLEKSIPTVTYVHEFAETTSAGMAFAGLSNSVCSIFSTQVTLDSFKRVLPGLSSAEISVIPQGLRTVGFSDSQSRSLGRLFDNSSNRRVIVGAGQVSLRKGVDLFVEVARKIRESDVGQRCVFVWCGDGATNGSTFSRLVGFQIRNAGLENDFHFIEGAAMEHMLRDADLFLLTSKLDPLPLVALEAAALGTVVLSFGGTGGLAEVLDLSEKLVAPAFDTDALARAAVTMLRDENLRNQYAADLELSVAKNLDFAAYLKKFAAVIASAKERLTALQAEWEHAQSELSLDSGSVGRTLTLREFIVNSNFPGGFTHASQTGMVRNNFD